MSTNRGMDKEDVVCVCVCVCMCVYIYIYIYMEYYSAIKGNEIMPFAATWMNLEIIILSDKSHKERQILYDIAHLWNLKRGYKWTYLQNSSIYRATDVENKWLLGVRGKRGINWGWRIHTTVCSKIGGGNGNSLQCSRLVNLLDRGAWWASVPGVTKSQTRLNDQHSC